MQITNGLMIAVVAALMTGVAHAQTKKLIDPGTGAGDDIKNGGFGGTVSTGNGGSTHCWGTGIGNPGFYANPTTNSRLISPAIDLTPVAAAELNFAHAIDLDTGDSAVVRIFNTDTDDEIVAGDFPLTISDANLSAAPWETSGPHALPAGAPIRIEWILSGTGGASVFAATAISLS